MEFRSYGMAMNIRSLESVCFHLRWIQVRLCELAGVNG